MKNMNVTTLKIFDVLNQFFNLPERVIELDLHIDMEHSPILKITHIPNVQTVDTVTKKFTITEISNDNIGFGVKQ